jgi:hypothetical protein
VTSEQKGLSSVADEQRLVLESLLLWVISRLDIKGIVYSIVTVASTNADAIASATSPCPSTQGCPNSKDQGEGWLKLGKSNPTHQSFSICARFTLKELGFSL